MIADGFLTGPRSLGAYQGYGGKLDVKKVFEVNDFAASGLTPDLTFFVSITPQKAFARAVKKHKFDRIENKTLSFYKRVNGGFKNLKLSDYKGKWVVMCIYPGDFTFV